MEKSNARALQTEINDLLNWCSFTTEELIEKFDNEERQARNANIKKTLQQMENAGLTLDQIKSITIPNLDILVEEADKDISLSHTCGGMYEVGMACSNHADIRKRRDLVSKATSIEEIIAAF